MGGSGPLNAAMPVAPAAGRARVRAFGLTFDTEVEMPGALPLPDAAEPGAAAPDVTVEIGAVRALPPRTALAGFWRVPGPGLAQLETEDVRVRVSDGCRIRLQPLNASGRARLGLIAGGWAATALLHQRARMPLHAALAAGAQGAALFVGGPGAGKSTLTRLLAQAGMAPGGDDLAALEFDGDGPPRASRGLGAAKLFADSDAAVGALGGAAAATGYGKALRLLPDRDAPDAAGAPARWPAPVRAAFALEWLHPASAPCELARIAPAQAMARLRAAISHPELVPALGLEQAYFPLLARLAFAVPMFALRRPRRFEASAGAVALIRRVLGGDLSESETP